MSIRHLSGNWWSAGILVAPQHNPLNVCKGFQGKKGQTVMPAAECQCFHPAVAKGNVLSQLHYCLRWAQLPSSLFRCSLLQMCTAIIRDPWEPSTPAIHPLLRKKVRLTHRCLPCCSYFCIKPRLAIADSASELPQLLGRKYGALFL